MPQIARLSIGWTDMWQVKDRTEEEEKNKSKKGEKWWEMEDFFIKIYLHNGGFIISKD